MPRLPPVTTTLCIVSRQLSRRRDVERGNEFDHGGHFVRRQLRPAIGEDFFADLVAAAWVATIGQNHIGNHDRTRDRAAPRSRARHPDPPMPGDHRFDLLRVNLPTPDIYY